MNGKSCLNPRRKYSPRPSVEPVETTAQPSVEPVETTAGAPGTVTGFDALA